jgi:hypothetical protein
MVRLSEPLLKFACLLLTALLLFQLARLVFRNNPLERLQVPELPTLQAAGEGTNVAAGLAAGMKGTNAVTSTNSGAKATNSATGQVSGKSGTNSVSGGGSEQAGTNVTAAESPESKSTNIIASQESGKADTNAGRSRVAGARDTNAVPTKESGKQGTNSVPDQTAGKAGTNSGPRQGSARGGPGFGPGQPPKPAELPPIIQARVDKITLSELFAPVIRPQPMALLGIAGKNAFLRATSGQTGMVKEGDELGGMKLLRIGINRVLIEHEGEKKELTMFSGFGSDSLLPKKKESTNEIITKPK